MVGAPKFSAFAIAGTALLYWHVMKEWGIVLGYLSKAVSVAFVAFLEFHCGTTGQAFHVSSIFVVDFEGFTYFVGLVHRCGGFRLQNGRTEN